MLKINRVTLHFTSLSDITIQSVILKHYIKFYSSLLIMVHMSICAIMNGNSFGNCDDWSCRGYFENKHEAVTEMHCSSSSEEIWPPVQRSCPYITWGFHSCALIEMKMLFNPFLIHAHVYKSWYCFLQHCVALQHFKMSFGFIFYSCMYVVGNTWL